MKNVRVRVTRVIAKKVCQLKFISEADEFAGLKNQE